MNVKKRVKAPRYWTKVQHFTYVKHVFFFVKKCKKSEGKHVSHCAKAQS